MEYLKLTLENRNFYILSYISQHSIHKNLLFLSFFIVTGATDSTNFKFQTALWVKRGIKCLFYICFE